MATFLQLQQDLGAQCGLDQTVTSNATLLKRWINKSQQAILRSFPWPFNRAVKPLVIQTETDYTTGTVATVAGSSTITFSSAPAASQALRYIQTSSSNDWYRIETHTAATTTATIEVGAIYTAAAATYTSRKIYYSTGAAVDSIIQIYQSILPYQLQETSKEYFQAVNPGFLSSGTPLVYMPCGVDASGFPQFILWPTPDALINLSVDYQRTATDLSADADVSVIPAKWHTSVLLDGAKVEAYEFLDDTRKKESIIMFEAGIEEMKTEYELGLKRHRVMTSVDNQVISGGLGYMPLPFYYPRGS